MCLNVKKTQKDNAGLENLETCSNNPFNRAVFKKKTGLKRQKQRNKKTFKSKINNRISLKNTVYSLCVIVR